MDLRESKISTGNGVGRHPWERARKNVVVDILKSNFDCNKSATVLDIGCGDTWLVEQLSAEFPNLKFIAVDTAFDAELLLQYRYRLRNKPIEVYESLDSAFSSSPSKIDIVLLLDVIEHIQDDIGFLKWVQTYSDFITNKTRFIITVPAYQNLFCEHDHFLGHYRRYTNRMLEEHVAATGLKVEKIGYFFSLLLLPRFYMVMKERISKKTSRAIRVGGWKSSPFDNLLSFLLLSDYKVSKNFRKAGIKLPGLSNYVICKKSV